MTDKSKEARFFIRKQGYFYRPNSKGYTSSAICAGLYTKEEAIRITHPNGPDGPRDGMSYIAEHIWHDEDWQKYRALLSERDALRAQLQAARDEALEEAAKIVVDEGKEALKYSSEVIAKTYCDDAALKIRALKSTSAEGEG
jgi:hypothetical protein